MSVPQHRLLVTAVDISTAVADQRIINWTRGYEKVCQEHQDGELDCGLSRNDDDIFISGLALGMDAQHEHHPLRGMLCIF